MRNLKKHFTFRDRRQSLKKLDYKLGTRTTVADDYMKGIGRVKKHENWILHSFKEVQESKHMSMRVSHLSRFRMINF